MFLKLFGGCRRPLPQSTFRFCHNYDMGIIGYVRFSVETAFEVDAAAADAVRGRFKSSDGIYVAARKVVDAALASLAQSRQESKTKLDAPCTDAEYTQLQAEVGAGLTKLGLKLTSIEEPWIREKFDI